MISAIMGFVQGTMTPLLTAVVLALLGVFFTWLGKRCHIEVNQKDQNYLENMAVRAIAFAEEEAAEFLKMHGSCLPSESKLADAVTFLLRAAPKLDQQKAQDLITGMLGKVKGAGATGEKAVRI